MTHFLCLASYRVAATAAGFMLPRTLPHLDPMLCYLIAGAGFLAAAVLHDMISCRLAQRDGAEQLDQVYDEINELREVNRGLIADVTRAREEMAVLCEVVETAADGSNQALVREMKVLQSQLGEFGDVKVPKTANVERRRTGAKRAPKAVPTSEPDSTAALEPVPAPEPESAEAAVTLRPIQARIADEETLKAKSADSEVSLVVESIEKEADVIEVLEYGFDYGQGYLFGTPKPSREEANAA